MRVVRNIVATGRTITVTIHQPAIDIFEVSLTDSTQLESVFAAANEKGVHFLPVHAVCRPAGSVKLQNAALASAFQQLEFQIDPSAWQ